MSRYVTSLLAYIDVARDTISTCRLAPWVISLASSSQRGLRVPGLRSEIQLEAETPTTQEVRVRPVPSPPGTTRWTHRRMEAIACAWSLRSLPRRQLALSGNS